MASDFVKGAFWLIKKEMKTRRLLLPLRFSFKKAAALFLFVAFVCISPCIRAANSQSAATPSPEHRALAEKLSAAISPAAEQGFLIDSADRALLQGHALRYALLDIAFQRWLEGRSRRG